MYRSRCSRSRIQVLGGGDKWAKGSAPPFLAVLEQATAEQGHGCGADLEKNTLVDHLSVLFEVCHHGCQSGNCQLFRECLRHRLQRKMVCWLGATPRPRRLLPPLEGGGGQPCTGLRVVLPLARKSPASASLPKCREGARVCRHVGGVSLGAEVDLTNSSDPPAMSADGADVSSCPCARFVMCWCARPCLRQCRR